jgi:hypothetical protein
LDFEERCRRLLPRLEREALGERFHVAAVGAPAVLSSWTSAHLALALQPIDPVAALGELRALYAACHARTACSPRSSSQAIANARCARTRSVRSSARTTARS